jgi:hypothetical protein
VSRMRAFKVGQTRERTQPTQTQTDTCRVRPLQSHRLGQKVVMGSAAVYLSVGRWKMEGR